MRVLVLHSDIGPDASPDDADTLVQAAQVKEALVANGHHATCGAFRPDPFDLEALVERERPDVVFNLVETVWQRGVYAPMAADMLDVLRIPFTGAGGAAIAATNDKLFAKRLLKAAGLPTPRHAEAPGWAGVEEGLWIVKSVSEDASLALDDGAVVCGRAHVAARAARCASAFGGRWFAEAYVDGREFNVAILERDGRPDVLPIAEMVFREWDESRPRIVGYAAKWNAAAREYHATVRDFAWARREPLLNDTLARLAKESWALFGPCGYARVDFRLDADGQAYILEINPNPCLEASAGFAAAYAETKQPYASLIEAILAAAIRG